MRQPATQPIEQLFGELVVVIGRIDSLDNGFHRLAHRFVSDTEYRRVQHSGMAYQQVLGLLWVDIDAPGDDQVVAPVGQVQVTVWVKASTTAAYFAALVIDSAHHDTAHAASVAKTYVSDAVNRVAGEALRLHGGIGFTWDHDLHLYLQRARVNALLNGDATFHREQLRQSLEATRR